MAEVALAATVLKLVTSASQIIADLYKFGSALGNAGLEVCLMANDIECISQSLRFLRSILETDGNHLPEARAIAERHITLCEKVLASSESLIDRLRPLIEEPRRRWNLNLDKRMMWVFQKPTFLLHRQSIESLKSSLNLLVSSMNYAELKKSTKQGASLSVLQAQLEYAITQAEKFVANPSLRFRMAMPQHNSGSFPLQLTGAEHVYQANNAIMSPETNEDHNHQQNLRHSNGMATSTTSHQSTGSRNAVYGANHHYDSDTSSIAEIVDLTIHSGPGQSAVGASNSHDDNTDHVEAIALIVETGSLERETAVLSKQVVTGSLPSLKTGNMKKIPKVAWVCKTFEDFAVARQCLDEEFVRTDTLFIHGKIGTNDVLLMHDDLLNTANPSIDFSSESIGLVLAVGDGHDYVAGAGYDGSMRFLERDRRSVVVGQDLYFYNQEPVVPHKPPTPWLDHVLLNFRTRMFSSSGTWPPKYNVKHIMGQLGIKDESSEYPTRDEYGYSVESQGSDRYYEDERDCDIEFDGRFLIFDYICHINWSDNYEVRKVVDTQRPCMFTAISYRAPKDLPRLLICGADNDSRGKFPGYVAKSFLLSFNLAEILEKDLAAKGSTSPGSGSQLISL